MRREIRIRRGDGLLLLWVIALALCLLPVVAWAQCSPTNPTACGGMTLDHIQLGTKLNLTPLGSPPINPSNGDLWSTASGFFGQVNGSTVGPFGTGGSGGSGTVTSAGLTMPSSLFTVVGSPITASGTLAVSLANQTANYVWAGPSSGSPAAPGFRALVSADIPTIPASGVSGLQASATTDTTNATNITTGTLNAARLPNSGALSINIGTGSGVDTETLVQGSNVTITQNTSAHTLTVAATGGSGGSGTVTSAGLTMPSSLFTVVGSPITASGTLAVSLANQTANYVWAGPSSGSPAAPGFRALVSADIPTIPASGVSGLQASATTDTTNATNITTGTLNAARLPNSGALSINIGTGSGVDTETLVQGSNVTITQNTSAHTLTVAATGGSGAVTSVSGTTGQVNVSPTTGAAVVSLPGTITQAENFTGGLQSGGFPVATLARAGYNDANTTIPAGISYATTCNTGDSGCTVGAWTASATYTLSANFDGFVFRFADTAGDLSNTAAVTIAPPAGYTMVSGGAVSNLSLNAAYMGVACAQSGTVFNCVPYSLTSATAGTIPVSQGLGTAPAWVVPSGDATMNTNGVFAVYTVHGATYPTAPGAAGVCGLYASALNTVTCNTVPVAAGGTGGKTGAAAAQNMSHYYVPCTATLASITGSTTETAVATCAIPGNEVGTNGRLDIVFYGTLTANANANTWKLYYASAVGPSGTACTSQASSSTSTGVLLAVKVLETGATNSQTCISPISNVTNTIAGTTSLAMTVDTTATTYVTVTATLNSSDTANTMIGAYLGVTVVPGTGGN